MSEFGSTHSLLAPHSQVFIMLGTNDARQDNWHAHGKEYLKDYAAFIQSFLDLSPRPAITLMIPPPLYRDGRYNFNQTVINTLLPQLVRQAARAAQDSTPDDISDHTTHHPDSAFKYNRSTGLPVIDIFSIFEKHCPVVGGTPGHPANSTDVPCDWIGWNGIDACHPNNVGYAQIARAVRASIIQ